MSIVPPVQEKGKVSLVYEFVKTVFPLVDGELEKWRTKASFSPDPELKKQALASIGHKRFHALGGCFFALNHDGVCHNDLVRFITAFQTISDYLDNLCDRGGVLDGKAFRRLHDSMLTALSPHEGHKDYYQYYPHREDGGYLEALVACCQGFLRGLPSYGLVQESALHLVGLYCDLQVYKHLVPEKRVPSLKAWYDKKCRFPQLFWWEFAAAAGSTLGVFALVTAALNRGMREGEGDAILSAYFPWICGLHILLDYYIDQEEDRREGDLNFISFYDDGGARRERLLLFTDRALQEAKRLSPPSFHQLVVQGLLAMYLSDAKIKKMGLKREAGLMLQKGGLETKTLHTLCHLLRRKGTL